MTRLTIFTPTYNRAATLPRLFESLARQSDRDFEWLVVDDGSTDGTRSLVNAWVDQAPFPVRYFFQPNSGKPAATNAGVRAARGELFWTVDSDDWLPDDVVVRMLEVWDEITFGGRADIASLTGLCVTPDGMVVGDGFPAALLESNSLEMSIVHRVSGDKAGWTRTDVMRRFPFPEGEFNFIPEGIVWNSVARNYRTVYVDEPFLVKEYQADGYTRKGVTVNPLGMALYHASLLNEGASYLVMNPCALARSAASYSRFSRAAGVPWVTLLRRLERVQMRFLVLALGPVGWWLRRCDRQDRHR